MRNKRLFAIFSVVVLIIILIISFTPSIIGNDNNTTDNNTTENVTLENNTTDTNNTTTSSTSDSTKKSQKSSTTSSSSSSDNSHVSSGYEDVDYSSENPEMHKPAPYGRAGDGTPYKSYSERKQMEYEISH